MTGTTRPRAVVIGAGPAGLAAALTLERRFPEPGDVVVLERSRVAASWQDRYAELRLNTTRRTSSLPGRHMARSAGRWVSRDDYVRYLRAAAESLRSPVRVGTAAHGLRVTPDGGWVVETAHGPVTAGNVVVATGNEALPHTPAWPRREVYQGTVRHVAELRALAELGGRRIVIVGAGNSGVDVAGHLAALGAEVTVAVRTPPTIVPREHLGVPLQPVAVATRWLPLRMRDVMTTATSRLSTGDLAGYGLPRADIGPYTRFARTGVTVAVDSGFVQGLRDGRIRVVPAAVGWTRTGVSLSDGSTADGDAVVFATGFRCDLERLVGQLGVLDGQGRPRGPLPGPVVGRPGLFFAGYRPAVEGSLRRHAADARRIAARAR